MTFIKQLHLRENWPLWVAILATCLLFIVIFSLRYQVTAPFYQPTNGEIVDYWSLISQHQSRTTGVSFIFVILYVVTAWIVLIAGSNKSILVRLISIPLILLATMFMCIYSIAGSLQNDGTILRQLQSISHGEHKYHLTAANTLGGGGDWVEAKYYLYQCDETGKTCTVVYSTINKHYYTNETEFAFFSIEATALFVTLGSEKISIDDPLSPNLKTLNKIF